jgi:aspartate aminotransferase-like enzyme
MRLYTPGPVIVPAAVAAACALQPMHHRSAAFKELSQRVWMQLQHLYRTEHPVVVLAGSGMTAIEAAIASTTRPGDQALVVDNGRFADRIASILVRYGAHVHRVTVAWGERVDVLPAVEHLDIAWFVHSETSTGVALDIASLAQQVRAHHPDILIGVDGITSVGVHSVQTDAWQLDLVVTASQKGLMCPPGLATVSISPRAETRMRSMAARTYTLDLSVVLDHQRKGLFAWTPPVTLIAGLDVALQLILDEGLDHVIARHADVTRYLHARLTDHGLRIFGDGTSHALTAVDDVRADVIRRALAERHDMMVAGGQDRLAGRIFRIGTCGNMHRSDIDELMTALIDVLTHLPSA